MNTCLSIEPCVVPRKKVSGKLAYQETFFRGTTYGESRASDECEAFGGYSPDGIKKKTFPGKTKHRPKVSDWCKENGIFCGRKANIDLKQDIGVREMESFTAEK